jgi:opacity protein-like surface antigen
MKTIITLLVLCSSSLFAQLPLGAGLKVGVPLSDAFDIAANPDRDYFSNNQQYIVGGSLELRLPMSLAVEGNALYTKFNFSSRNLLSTLTSGGTSNSWEFPILVKYRFSGTGPVRPFVGAGPTFRRIQDVLQIGAASIEDKTSKGVVVGAGLEVRLLFIRITPEMRFSRWGGQSFRDATNILFEANKNQGQFLVGISF